MQRNQLDPNPNIVCILHVMSEQRTEAIAGMMNIFSTVRCVAYGNLMSSLNDDNTRERYSLHPPASSYEYFSSILLFA